MNAKNGNLVLMMTSNYTFLIKIFLAKEVDTCHKLFGGEEVSWLLPCSHTIWFGKPENDLFLLRLCIGIHVFD